MLVTKEFTFDMGHRLPNHNGKCRNIHGHTYKLQVTVEGNAEGKVPGASDEGMVIDFSDLKKIVKGFIDEHLDHFYMSYGGDTEIVDFIKSQGYALTVVDFVPTAENMVKWLWNDFEPKFSTLNVALHSIKLWETPTSFAELTK